jgi:hypothetical protein
VIRRPRDKFIHWLFVERVGGKVISAEAQVDPARFSEDEYPVFCRKCDYPLRGLPDGRCPECGTEFQRGRLLVEQYVLRTRLGKTRLGKFSVRCIIVASGIFALVLLGDYLIMLVGARSPTAAPTLDVLGFAIRASLYVARAALVVDLVGLACLLAAIRRDRQKRRRLLEAIGSAD